MPREKGFSLIEMLMAMLIFSVLSAAVFGLLAQTQRRYKVESEFLDTFQGARLAIDQILRDVHSSGYPPINFYTGGPGGQAVNHPELVAWPFAWAAADNYPATPCAMTGPACAAETCVAECPAKVPGSNDLMVETNVDPQLNASVDWIRYKLDCALNSPVHNVLQRGTAAKTAAGDPAAITALTLMPYVDYVMNCATVAEMTAIRNSYPTMFPGNAQVPVFTYTFDAGQPQDPTNIREVNVILIVMSPTPDPTNGQRRLVALTGQGRRMNPRR